MTKNCSLCDKEKPLEDFHKDTSRDKRHSYCKPCFRIYERRNAAKIKAMPKVRPTYKECFRCKETKKSEDFPVDNSKISGLYLYCRTCTALLSKASRYGVSVEFLLSNGVPCYSCGSEERVQVSPRLTTPEDPKRRYCLRCRSILHRNGNDLEELLLRIARR